MTFLDRLRRVPLTVRAPMMVAALMIVISLIISERVLTRLHEMQEQQLTNVVGTYFDGLSTALIPAVLRQDIWETFDVLDRTRVLFRSITPLEAIVTGRDGSVLASSDPHEVPVLSQLPARFAGRSRDGGISIDWNERRGFGARPLIYQGKPIGALYASFDIGHLVAERRQVLTTLLATNAALAAIFATVGYMLARRMVEPIATLTKHMRSGATGTPQRIELKKFPAGSGEITELFNGFNDLVHAQRERTALTHRLAEEEKLASLGRLASSMAHEINNPLGGLFNTIDTLRRHGANDGVRETSLSLLSRGLSGIREVVQAALATYRPDQNGRGLVLSDLEDVRLLAGPAITGRNQVLDWQSTHAGVK
ncbi:MAG: sensor histidine kinase, partial [Pseudorhizobium sp.]